MQRYSYFILILIFMAAFAACDKDDDIDNGEKEPLVYESLEAEDEEIEIGETTKVTATASGTDLTYNWSTTGGSIVGSGSTITYASDPCEPGEHTITCEVVDAFDNSESKSVIINVVLK